MEQREIKFRGKDMISGKWSYGYLVISGDNYYILEKWVKGKGHRQIMVYPDSVGQYTGLKDKDGKEIYEGDILKMKFSNFLYPPKNHKTNKYRNDVKFWENLYVVDYVCGGFYKDLIKDNRPIKSLNSYAFCSRSRESFEVVGNRFENPDLIHKQ